MTSFVTNKTEKLLRSTTSFEFSNEDTYYCAVVKCSDWLRAGAFHPLCVVAGRQKCTWGVDDRSLIGLLEFSGGRAVAYSRDT